MYTLLTYEIIDTFIGKITLHRPKAANALSSLMLDELNDVVETIHADNTVRVVIITGAGNVFSAGADLKERREMTDQEVVRAVKKIGDTVSNVEQLSIPVIAAINGAAYGGGLELALACDIRMAAREIKMGLTETSLAIIPGAGGTQRLPRLIGIGQAKRLIYTATPVDAIEAHKLGLVELITNKEDLQTEALNTARRIAMNGPIAVRQAKAAIDYGMETDLQTGLFIEHASYKETIQTKDRLEGLQAFSEKRKPDYKGE